MIGVVIVTHVNLAEQFIEAGKMILGEMKQVESVGIFNRESVDEMRSKIIDAIKKVDSGDGVIILVDMFGGTPSNMALAFLEEGKVEVVTGVNLPMIIKLNEDMRKKDLKKLATILKDSARQNISIASEKLNIRAKISKSK
jgi:PTS system mannose-specific IIA component